MPVKIMVGFSLNHEALAVGCVDVFKSEDMSCHRDGEQPQCKCSTHGFRDAQRVDGMMGMHHTHVPVCSNSHQEEGTSAAVHCQHEEANVAEILSKHPLDLRGVVAGTEWQNHDEQKISHCQVKEQHRAALPWLQVEAEDPESQTISKDSQNKLCCQEWREHTDQQSAIKIAFHVEFSAALLAADERNNPFRSVCIL